MAAKQSKESCVYCGAKTSQESFCPKCRQPTPHITARERILWELGQWRSGQPETAAVVPMEIASAHPIQRSPVQQTGHASETVAPAARIVEPLSQPQTDPIAASVVKTEQTTRTHLTAGGDTARIHRVSRPGSRGPAAVTNGSQAMALEQPVPETVVSLSPPPPTPTAAERPEPTQKVLKREEKESRKRNKTESQKLEASTPPRQRTQKPARQRIEKPIVERPADTKARVAFELLPGEQVEMKMRGWSRLRPATLVVTSYRVAITRFPGRVKWMPLEEVRRSRSQWRGAWSLILEASVELITFQKMSRQKLEALTKAVNVGVGESRAPGSHRHDAGLLQEWCDLSMNVWDSQFGKLILFVKWHPVALLTFGLFATAGVRAAVL